MTLFEAYAYGLTRQDCLTFPGITTNSGAFHGGSMLSDFETEAAIAAVASWIMKWSR